MIRSGLGDDSIQGGVGSDSISGNGGNDYIFYSFTTGPADNDTLYGGAGNDRIDYSGATGNFRTLAQGNKGDDEIRGGIGADLLYGNEDRDTIFGRAGADYILGGSGNDLLLGEGGNDTVDGGAGNDTIYAQPLADLGITQPVDIGSDLVLGGEGDDDISYARARDRQTIFGGNGADRITGSGYNAAGDVIYGNDGNDFLQGFGGSDFLSGGAGNDVIQASQGYEEDGRDGAPFVGGNPTLVGGLGADDIQGGSPAVTGGGTLRETDVFRPGDSPYVRGATFDRSTSDSVLAFHSGVDRIATGTAGTTQNFASASVSSFSDAQAFAEAQIATGKTYAYVVENNFGSVGLLFWDSNGDRSVDFQIQISLPSQLAFTDIV